MNNLRFLLLFSLLHLAILVPAQNFKVIKETDDYILKECDYDYYYMHGLHSTDNFVLDTNVKYVINGIMKLPLDNGKFVDYKMAFYDNEPSSFIYILYGFNKVLNSYLVEKHLIAESDGMFDIPEWFLINKQNGVIKNLCDKPINSPSDLYYSYSINGFEDTLIGYVIIDNITANKNFKIPLNNQSPIGLKWIDDKSFVLITVYIGERHFVYRKCGYYLVEIKK